MNEIVKANQPPLPVVASRAIEQPTAEPTGDGEGFRFNFRGMTWIVTNWKVHLPRYGSPELTITAVGKQ